MSRPSIQAILRTLGEGLLWLLLSALVVVVASWPLALRVQTDLLEPLHLPDVQGGLFWPWAFARSLWAGEPLYFRPELQWPDGQSLRLIVWNHGVQLLIFPFFLSFSPITATNLAAMWLATLNGAAGAWAGHAATGRRWGALLGLCIAACAPYGLIEAGVGRPEQGLWAPLALYFGGLVRLWADPEDRRGALVCGLGVGLAGAVYWFYAIFLVTLMAAVLPVAAAAGALGRRRLGALALAGATSVAVALPFLLPLLLARGDAAQMIASGISAGESVEVLQRRAVLLLPWGHLGPWSVAGERAWQAPLLVLPASLLAALVGRGGVRLAGVMGVLAAIFAAGPVLLGADGAPLEVGGHMLALPQRWLNGLPGYGRFWWPYRWQGVMLGAACVAGPALAARLPRPAVWAVLLGAWSAGESALMLRQGGGLPISGPARVPPIFAQLGALEGVHPLLQLPLGKLRNSRVGWIPWHQQPIDGGMGWGLMPEHVAARRERLAEIPLVSVLEDALADEKVRIKTDWTAEEAGGYHYIVLYLTELDGTGRQQTMLRLRRALGPPFYRDAETVVWAVPGVGRPLPPAIP